jgi:hypothetical protein
MDLSDLNATFRTRLLGFDKEQVRACPLILETPAAR